MERRMALEEHPTVQKVRARDGQLQAVASPIDASWLRELCSDAGADDVGFVELDRAELDDQREDILRVFPGTKTLVSLVCRMNRDPIRSPARSVANLEFHHVGDKVDDVARRIVRELETKGVRAVNPSMGFPMEMERFPGKIWVVSHKPVAVAAGLGHMGIHRNVIHPKFGNFILLGTVLLAADVSELSKPIDYNPCLDCKLCVGVCPVGAISPNGDFDFSACYTHNYREFMGGFTDWVEQIAASDGAPSYRAKVADTETVSMWQSLSYGANYKAAYCLAVCPAGEDVIGPFLEDKSRFKVDIVTPLRKKEETVYVVPGSDAEAYVARRFPQKQAKRVGNGLRPRSIRSFLGSLSFVFQKDKSKGMDTTYHFAFTGDERVESTVVIRDQSVDVFEGLQGSADLRVTADSATWIGFLAKERSLLWAILTRRIRIKGSPRRLIEFGRCFPS